MTTTSTEFETAMRQAERELREASTADDIRACWDKHVGALGHRALGRLLTGRPASELIDRRADRSERE
ncbi:MAG: hypothetical protein WD939_04015 [Dehalococcoidia bacterium]